MIPHEPTILGVIVKCCVYRTFVVSQSSRIFMHAVADLRCNPSQKKES
uniref:Uncharacterized protein n=1 Tax=Nelumbo nucifera TaxID=4432 RepID=A0A822ZN60_NELNU|nr:TPA_asm: hypothetical protein HUJ06_004557 [Nelumbo nucifera]